MIHAVFGPKGSGKTKEMIRSANDALDVCKGNIVFVTDTSDYSRDIRTAIRFVNIRDYGTFGEDGLLGFVKGVIASNADVKRIYIDGMARILGLSVEDMEELFLSLDDLSETHKVDLVIAVTGEKPPKYLKKYL